MAIRKDPYEPKARTVPEFLRFLVERAEAKQRAGRPGNVTIDLDDVKRLLELAEAGAALLAADDMPTRTEEGMLPMSHDYARAVGRIRSALEAT